MRGGADWQLAVGPVPESPDVQGGDIGLPVVLDAPAERPSGLQSAGPPGKCEGGGVGGEHLSDKGVIHFITRRTLPVCQPVIPV